MRFLIFYIIWGFLIAVQIYFFAKLYNTTPSTYRIIHTILFWPWTLIIGYFKLTKYEERNNLTKYEERNNKIIR